MIDTIKDVQRPPLRPVELTEGMTEVRLSVEAVRALRRLECGWDGEGGGPSASESCRLAEDLLLASYRGAQRQSARWIEPVVGTNGDGGVILNWHTSRGELVVYISPGQRDRVVCVSQTVGGAHERIVESLGDASEKVVSMIRAG